MVNTFQEKQGYKYTEEFGYIPEDWEYSKLEDVFDFIAGADVDKECFSQYWTNECCYPIYSNTLDHIILVLDKSLLEYQLPFYQFWLQIYSH